MPALAWLRDLHPAAVLPQTSCPLAAFRPPPRASDGPGARRQAALPPLGEARGQNHSTQGEQLHGTQAPETHKPHRLGSHCPPLPLAAQSPGLGPEPCHLEPGGTSQTESVGAKLGARRLAGLRPAPPCGRNRKDQPTWASTTQPFALKLPFPPVLASRSPPPLGPSSKRPAWQPLTPSSPARSLPHQCWAARGPLRASKPSSPAEQGPRGVRTALWVRTRNGCPRQRRQLRWACSQTTTSGRVSICGDPPST